MVIALKFFKVIHKSSTVNLVQVGNPTNTKIMSKCI